MEVTSLSLHLYILYSTVLMLEGLQPSTFRTCPISAMRKYGYGDFWQMAEVENDYGPRIRFHIT